MRLHSIFALTDLTKAKKGEDIELAGETLRAGRTNGAVICTRGCRTPRRYAATRL
jgi:hypothetical protein